MGAELVSLGPRVEPPEQKSGWADCDSRVTAGIDGSMKVKCGPRSQAEFDLVTGALTSRYTFGLAGSQLHLGPHSVVSSWYLRPKSGVGQAWSLFQPLSDKAEVPQLPAALGPV